MSEIETIFIKSAKDFRRWLTKNHKTKAAVLVTRYKKHAQPDTPTHLELMHEAICFGWIDTTLKRIDEDITGVTFRKRTPKASWSNNTLSYARKLIKEGRMMPQGLEAYNRAKDKPTIDHNLPKDFPPQPELLKALAKNKTAKTNWDNLAPSTRFMHIVTVERAKLPETRARRIAKIVELMKSLKPKEKIKGKY